MAGHQIRSPVPGTFYRKPAPDQPPFRQVGDRVSKGDVVGLVEVMKNFYEIKADAGGVITAFNVGDAEPVMAGQGLVDLD